MPTNATMRQNPDLPLRQCNRDKMHNPHEWADTAGPHHPPASYHCNGIWSPTTTCGEPGPHTAHDHAGRWCAGQTRTADDEITKIGIDAALTAEIGPPPNTTTILVTNPAENPLDELHRWWTTYAADTIKTTTRKIEEYGGTGKPAIDLIDIGRDIARIAGRDVTDEEATELGIYWYARGKFSRWTAAVMEGKRPSDDTLFDAMVYLTMAIRNRAAGGWPWASQQ